MFCVTLARYIRFMKPCCLIYEVVCGVQLHRKQLLSHCCNVGEMCVPTTHYTLYIYRFVMVSTEQTTSLCESMGIEVLWLPTEKKKII